MGMIDKVGKVAGFGKLRSAHDLSVWLTMGRVFTGLVWLNSGITKLTTPNFSITNTVGYFASKNPYPLYAGFLRNSVIANSALFTNLVIAGEILVGLSLIFGLFTNVGAFFGFFLSLNFFLAAGWTSPSTYSLNLNMVLVQLMFIAAYGTKYLSADQWIASKAKRLHWFLMSRPKGYAP